MNGSLVQRVVSKTFEIALVAVLWGFVFQGVWFIPEVRYKYISFAILADISFVMIIACAYAVVALKAPWYIILVPVGAYLLSGMFFSFVGEDREL